MLLVALFAVAGLVSRAMLYFGPDPEPEDYSAQHRRLSFEFAGLPPSGAGNGWAHLSDALTALSDAEAEAFGGDRIIASETIESVRNDPRVSDEEIALFARLRELATEAGAFDALDRLAAAPGAANPRAFDSLAPDVMDGRGDARALARCIGACMVDAEYRADGDAFVAHARHALAVARAQQNNLNLVDYLTGIAIAHLVFDLTHQALAADWLTRDQLLALHSELTRFRPPALADVLRGEKLISMHMIADMTVPGIAPKAVSRGYQLGKLEPRYDRLIEVAELPFKERPHSLEEPESGGLSIFAPDLTSLTLPAIDGAIGAADLGEASLAGVRLHVAIEAYRLTHGSPPSALSDLVPEFFDSLPTEPRGAGGIVYVGPESLSGEGGRPYLLYAIGFDNIDNRGAHVPDDVLGSVYLAPGDPLHDFVFNPAPREPRSRPSQ